MSIAKCSRGWLVATAVAAILSISVLDSRVLDTATPKHPILDSIAAALDQRGIDVVRGYTTAVPLGERARVTPLVGMPTNRPSGYANASWMREFVAGRANAGVVAGVETGGRGGFAATSDEFRAAWSAAPRERRVFLSFTSQDAAAARATAEAFTADGYVTFIFLNEADAPRYDARTVGALFSEAGHHFVLDTPNARKSAGVWLEARIAKVTAGRESRYLPERDEPPRAAPAGSPTGGGGGGFGGLNNEYRAPNLAVNELYRSNRVVKESGGVMFGNPATPCAALAGLPIQLVYHSTATSGARLHLMHSGVEYPVKARDQEVAIVASFVEDGRPVIVNLTSRGIPSDRPDSSFRRVELHPAFVDTPLGDLLIRADMLIWPLIYEEEPTFDGRHVAATGDINAVRSTYGRELRTNYVAGALKKKGGAVSNLNDVSSHATFCSDARGVSLSGRLGIDLLFEGAASDASVRFVRTSAALQQSESTMVRALDAPAYDAALRTMRLAGLMRYVKATQPTAWAAFVRSLPPLERRAHTPRVVCRRCDPTELMNWIARHSAN